MATGEQKVTYWLCPAEPARNYLAEVIRDLAARFDAPTFEPHMTIYVTGAEQENAARVLVTVAKEQRPVRSGIHGLDYSDKFTKTLFVQLAADAELTGLSEKVRRASASQNDYELNPHLSLIYKTMEEETKRQLATSIKLPFTEIVFDTVKAVLTPAEINSREDLEAWRVIAEATLAK